jgi:hypothetical protein
MVAERVPFARNSAQETDTGRGMLTIEPTTDGACTRRRRCLGRDPTCQYKPNATHAPKRGGCLGTLVQCSPFRDAEQRGWQIRDP